MSQQFKPFSLDSIDEGEFLERIDEELLSIQSDMEAFRVKHGDAASKATAELQVTLKLTIIETGDGGYAIRPGMKKKLPSPPASVSMAMGAITQDGKQAVMVRASGSDRDNPRQSKFCDRRGEPTDGADAEESSSP